MANTAKIIIQAVDNASKTLTKIRGEMEKTSKSTSKFAQALDKQQKQQIARQKAIATSMKMVGGAAIAMGAVSTGALVAVTRAAMNFEEAFAGVRKTINATEEEFLAIKTSILKMSTEIPIAATELARIGEIAGQLGVRGVDNLDKFIREIAKIDVATNLTADEAAVAMAQIANVMGEPLDNIDRMASVLVGLGNQFATDEKKIVTFAKRLSAVGSIVGLTTSDVFGLSAAFAQLGVEPEAGATAIQRAFLFMKQSASGSTAAFIDNTSEIEKNTGKLDKLKDRLNVAKLKQGEFTDKTKGSTKAQINQNVDRYTGEIAALESGLGVLNDTQGQAVISQSAFAKVIGVTNEEFEDLFAQDPAQAFQKFLEGLDAIEEEGGDATSVLDELELASARSLRTLLAGAKANEKVSQALGVSKTLWAENTAATREFEKRMETTAKQMELLRGNVTFAAITLGDALLPAINKIVQALIPMVQGFARFAQDNPQLIIGILGVVSALGALATSLFVTAAIVNSLKILKLATGFKSLGATIGIVRTALLGFMSTWGLWILVIAGVVAIIITLLDSLGLLELAIKFLKEFGEAMVGLAQFMIGKLGEWITVVTGLSGATRDLKEAEDELQVARDARLSAEKAMLVSIGNVELAREKLRKKQEELNDIEKKYGTDSPEYVAAVRERRVAQIDLQQDMDDSIVKINEYNASEQEYIDQKDNITTATDQIGKDLERTKGFWDGVSGKIQGTIDKMREFFGFNEGGDQRTSTFTGFVGHAHGGVVKGPIDAPVPIIAHGGERVTPRTGIDSQGGGGGAGGIAITFNGPVNMDSKDRVQQLADMVGAKLGRENELARLGMSF